LASLLIFTKQKLGGRKRKIGRKKDEEKTEEGKKLRQTRESITIMFFNFRNLLSIDYTYKHVSEACVELRRTELMQLWRLSAKVP
jgi:hypothetical protein